MPTIFDFMVRQLAKDDRLFQRYFTVLDALKDRQQEYIIEVLDSYLIDSITDENGLLIHSQIDQGFLLGIENDLQVLYGVDNIQDVLQVTMDQLNDRISTIDQLMSDMGLEGGVLGDEAREFPFVTEEMERTMEAFRWSVEGDGVADGGPDRIRQAIQRYRLQKDGDEPVKRQALADELRVAAGVGPSYQNTVAGSAMASIDRGLRREQSGRAGVDYGRYVGPDDDLTRPFCALHLNTVQPWSYWDNLDNDMNDGPMKSPASKVAGGWNCRHRIIPWDPNW